jgi:hypothetical protein
MKKDLPDGGQNRSLARVYQRYVSRRVNVSAITPPLKAKRFACDSSRTNLFFMKQEKLIQLLLFS